MLGLVSWLTAAERLLTHTKRSVYLAWVDITTSVTPGSLGLYRQLVNHASPVYRSAALSIYNTLLAKGTKTPPEKLQVMSVLDVMAFIPSLEENSRSQGKSRSNEEERFRESLAKLLSSQGVEAIKVYEDVSIVI